MNKRKHDRNEMMKVVSKKISDRSRRDFASAFQRTSPGDWHAVARRIEAAERLGNRAFVERDEEAWEAVQLIEWTLQRRSNLRVTEPGDVHVLDTLYRAEEATLTRNEPPRGLSAKQFCALIEERVSEFTISGSSLTKEIESGALTLEDWRYVLYQWLATSKDFTRMIAVTALTVSPSEARVAYENLWDESGRGDWSKSHHSLQRKLLACVDISYDDDAALLDWAAPRVINTVTGQHRLLAGQHPEVALGSMYLYERLDLFELGKIKQALQAVGIREDDLAWLDEHIGLDPHHAGEWLGMLEGRVQSFESQCLAYEAAMTRGRLGRQMWEATAEGLTHLRKTGETLRLPARELISA